MSEKRSEERYIGQIKVLTVKTMKTFIPLEGKSAPTKKIRIFKVAQYYTYSVISNLAFDR
ncbi:hypothetical protein D3C80_1708530 [compost metagenome]